MLPGKDDEHDDQKDNQDEKPAPEQKSGGGNPPPPPDDWWLRNRAVEIHRRNRRRKKRNDFFCRNRIWSDNVSCVPVELPAFRARQISNYYYFHCIGIVCSVDIINRKPACSWCWYADRDLLCSGRHLRDSFLSDILKTQRVVGLYYWGIVCRDGLCSLAVQQGPSRILPLLDYNLPVCGANINRDREIVAWETAYSPCLFWST